jgi:rSAM/selenodomain-associated transferase 2
MNRPAVTIIIPTLNEAGFIGRTCRHLAEMGFDSELLIVDGGSNDDTVKQASAYGRIIHSPTGRAIQLNKGASVASGEIFWFLHADCLPHEDSLQKIEETLAFNGIVAGAFEYRLDADGALYRIAEHLSNRKNRTLNLMFGDMGIFVKKAIFEQMDGFREIPLMEDLDFCKRIKSFGKITILPYPIMTSARRWKKEGPVKNFVRNWFLQLAWAMGVSPFYLAKWYPIDVK